MYNPLIPVEDEILSAVDPEILDAIRGERLRQHNQIELIASENYVSPAVLAAQATVLTNKYAEGYPEHRYYGGCEFVDIVEELACKRARHLFGAEHVNVQPHSGSQANGATYLALLDPGDTVLSMNLNQGGHLTHGAKFNFSGRYYNFFHYGVDRETEMLDYDAVAELAKKHNPKLILAGASAYPRVIDFPRLRTIADSVGAFLMVDIAHIAGLVAGGAHPSPVPHSDVVTSTTHKTMRGPRAGFIMCKSELASRIDKAVFPGLQGGPLMHTIASKAVSFTEALKPEFKTYAHAIVENGRILARKLAEGGLRIVSGGTDNNIVLVDIRNTGLNGKECEDILARIGITANKNLIPFDPAPPRVTSGIRLGTPAVTTRGFGKQEMVTIAECIVRILRDPDNEALQRELSSVTRSLCDSFPVPVNGPPPDSQAD